MVVNSMVYIHRGQVFGRVLCLEAWVFVN